jgi:hypothetical protein
LFFNTVLALTITGPVLSLTDGAAELLPISVAGHTVFYELKNLEPTIATNYLLEDTWMDD